MRKIYLLFLLTVPFFFQASCKKKSDSLDSPSNAELIQKLKAVSDSVMNAPDLHIPGLVALVVDNNKGIDWIYTAGVSDIPNNLPMNSGYTFRIGSNTKTMTGTVILQLVDEGKLKLEDKLSKYFPSFPKSDSITIRMLCNMTSGIFNYSEAPEFADTLLKDPTMVWQPLGLLEIAFNHAFYFPVGTGFHYSNSNTIILGLIIEKLTNSDLNTQIANRIYNPLNLQNTGFLTSGTELPGAHGRGYYEGAYLPGNDLTEYFDMSWAWAAGSAYSTPRELQQYVERMVGGGYLSDSLQQRRLNDMTILPNGGYGLCLVQRGTFYGHNGGCPGFTSSMYHSNQRNCTVIIYFNCQLDNYIPDQLFFRFANILYGADF
ncbi:MAG: beta-lactamase family protein [Bacteroidales bacterium]|nr:beta-lactamase family protein [Bacteroidales bacterium]